MSDYSPYAPRPTRPPPRRSGLRTPVNIVIVVVIAVALAALLTWCVAHGGGGGAGAGAGRGAHGGRGGRGGQAGAQGGRPAITVGVAKAAAGDIPITVQALGTVTPLATVSVNARVAGMLDKVAFREGQMVRKGQLLAQIDPRPFQAALQQAQGTLTHDQALLANARLDLARYARLHAQDSIPAQTYDTQVALVRQDESQVVSDQGVVETARLNLTYTRIDAPVSGRIGLRQIDPGNEITANESTPFAVVTQMDPTTVIFSVPESAIAPIEQHGGSGLTTTALDRAGGNVIATGTLSTLDNLIDTTTGTVKARSVFHNAGGHLFPNQFVNVTLLVDTLKNQVVVPTTAVRHGPQGDFVWVLQPDQTVKSRPVKVGPGTAETVSIASGLNLGETVITDGGDRLTDGGKVVLPGQNPVGPGGGAGGWRGRGGHGGHRHRPGGAGGQGGGGGQGGQGGGGQGGGGQDGG
jgi:multidrug efflux system membrane fusion protein